MRDLLADVDGTGPIASQLDALAHSGDAGAADLRGTLTSQLRTVHGMPAWYDLGVWVECARLALLSGDSAFLEPGGAPRRTFDRLVTARSDDREWMRTVAPLLRLLEDAAARSDRARAMHALGGVYRSAGG